MQSPESKPPTFIPPARNQPERDYNYHPRSNVYFATLDPEDADVVQRGCAGLLAGVAMVALQCMAVMGVAYGTIRPACVSSDQCHQAGMYCVVGARDRCDYCGSNNGLLPLQTDPATGGALNDAEAADFAGYNLTAVAEICADPSMYTGDWHTASSIVSWCKSGKMLWINLFIPGMFWMAQS
jgi:hypothetical protein